MAALLEIDFCKVKNGYHQLKSALSPEECICPDALDSTRVSCRAAAGESKN